MRRTKAFFAVVATVCTLSLVQRAEAQQVVHQKPNQRTTVGSADKPRITDFRRVKSVDLKPSTGSMYWVELNVPLAGAGRMATIRNNRTGESKTFSLTKAQVPKNIEVGADMQRKAPVVKTNTLAFTMGQAWVTERDHASVPRYGQFFPTARRGDTFTVEVQGVAKPLTFRFPNNDSNLKGVHINSGNLPSVGIPGAGGLGDPTNGPTPQDQQRAIKYWKNNAL